MLNLQQVIGYMGSDLRSYEIKEGRMVVEFRIASTFKNTRTAEVREETAWFDVKLYCTPEAVDRFFSKILKKGNLVYLHGRTVQTSYVNRDGENVTASHIECDPFSVKLLHEKQVAPQSQGSAPARKSDRPTAVDHHRRRVEPSIGNPAPSIATDRSDLMDFDA